MIAIVDDDELEKRKASRIPQNKRINTSWAVGVWSESAEERNDLILIIRDSETIPQVNPEILNITDKDELESLAQQIRRRSLHWSRNSKVELQLIATRTFMRINFH